MKPGSFYPSLLATRSLNSFYSPAADRLHAILYPLPRKSKFDRIGIDIYYSSAPAGEKARLGIYNCNSSLYPSSLILDAGEVDISSAGLKEITISQILDEGNYFLAFNTSYSVDIMLGSRYLCPIKQAGDPDSTYIGYYKVQTYGALPDPFPSGASYEPYLYSVCLRLLEHL